MAALEIKNHFKGLRVQTARRRRDPFATGFEDDSSDDANAPRRRRRSRSDSDRSPHSSSTTTTTTTAAPVPSPVIPPPKAASNEASPFHALDALQDSGDDDFVTAPPKRPIGRTASPAPFPRPTAASRRRKSPEPSATARRDRRAAAALAAGPLAYLDDSEDEWDDRNHHRSDDDEDDGEDDATTRRRRADLRGYSPAPRKHSDSLDPSARASPPRGNRASPTEHSQTRAQPPRHTVASAFAGTKYLQDSDSEEEAVSSRRNSAENGNDPDLSGTRADLEDLTPYESAFTAHRQKHLEVKRVDKPKQNGSGVSWRAFSAGRSEQRTAEIEALHARLQQRGRCISFGTHATTDDGKRVPIPSLGKFCSDGRGRTGPRGKSPPRRREDVHPGDDEIADETAVTIDELGGFRNDAFSVTRRNNETSNTPSPPTASPTFASTISPTSEASGSSPPASPTMDHAMTDSVDSVMSRLIVSPQTIPEDKTVEHSMPTAMSPIALDSTISRTSSTRSIRPSNPRAARSFQSRRPSRRSTSNTASASPAAAFLSSWGSRDEKEAGPASDPNPDDEGQAIGLNDEYIIGRRIHEGGFGVIKEVHGINSHGVRTIAAVKIVRKSVPNVDEVASEKAQQDLEHEVSVWRHLKHRHILDLTAVYETDFATFCIMDLNVGGSLFDLLRTSRSSSDASTRTDDGRRGLTPPLARTYAYQLACALRYLHEDMRVCHRDVKLENCLVDLRDPGAATTGGVLRLCDFGLADFFDGGSSEIAPYSFDDDDDDLRPAFSSSVIGTLEYASPRGLRAHRPLPEPAGDVWAFGVVLFALCTGDLPFRHPLPSATAARIFAGDWDGEKLWRAVAAATVPGDDDDGDDSGDAADTAAAAVLALAHGCLEVDVARRLPIGDVLRSDWFHGCGSWDEAPQEAQGAADRAPGPSAWR